MKKHNGFCCAFRRKFSVGILWVDPDAPTPVDLVDNIVEWGLKGAPTIVELRIKFCPFCGVTVRATDPVRPQGRGM